MDTVELLKVAAERLSEKASKISKLASETESLKQENKKLAAIVKKAEREKEAREIVDIMSTKMPLSYDAQQEKIASLVDGSDDLVAMKKWAQDMNKVASHGEIIKSGSETKPLSPEDRFKQAFIDIMNNN